jgi:hypothetical protein
MVDKTELCTLLLREHFVYQRHVLLQGAFSFRHVMTLGDFALKGRFFATFELYVAVS